MFPRQQRRWRCQDIAAAVPYASRSGSRSRPRNQGQGGHHGAVDQDQDFDARDREGHVQGLSTPVTQPPTVPFELLHQRLRSFANSTCTTRALQHFETARVQDRTRRHTGKHFPVLDFSGRPCISLWIRLLCLVILSSSGQIKRFSSGVQLDSGFDIKNNNFAPFAFFSSAMAHMLLHVLLCSQLTNIKAECSHSLKVCLLLNLLSFLAFFQEVA